MSAHVAFTGPAAEASSWLLRQVMAAHLAPVLRAYPKAEQAIDRPDQPVTVLVGGDARSLTHTIGDVRSGTWPPGTRFIAVVPHLADADPPADLPPLQLGPCPHCGCDYVEVRYDTCTDSSHGGYTHVHRRCTGCDRTWAEQVPPGAET